MLRSLGLSGDEIDRIGRPDGGADGASDARVSASISLDGFVTAVLAQVGVGGLGAHTHATTHDAIVHARVVTHFSAAQAHKLNSPSHTATDARADADSCARACGQVDLVRQQYQALAPKAFQARCRVELLMASLHETRRADCHSSSLERSASVSLDGERRASATAVGDRRSSASGGVEREAAHPGMMQRLDELATQMMEMRTAQQRMEMQVA